MAKKKAVKSPADKAKTEYVRKAARKSGEQESFTFTYDDIARITGKRRNAVYQAVTRGSFDPTDLKSVFFYLARHATMANKKRCVEFILDPAAKDNPAG
jgi:hypothetical protein